MTGPNASRNWCSLQCSKLQIDAAVRGAASGLASFGYGVGGEVARHHAAVFLDPVALGEFTHLAVQQPAAELVAERVP